MQRSKVCAALVAFSCAAMAQGRAVVPPIATTWPGNAAVSMPLRWSQGTIQFSADSTLLPTNFVGQTIRGLRLRRPALLGEPPYAATQRLLTVRAGFTTNHPLQLLPDLVFNRPVNLQVVAGPAVFAVAATQPATAAQPLGAEFLVIPFAVPLPVTAGNLFVEIETGTVPMTIGDAWCDAVWMEDGVDHGYVAAIGDGACTRAGVPLQLTWAATDGPQRGTDAVLSLMGALPGAGVFGVAGIEPEARPFGGDYLGFGGSLAVLDAGLVGCHQWTPLDALFLGVADAAGNWNLVFNLEPSVTTTQMRVGVQAGHLDFGRPGLPLSVSNGVMLRLDSSGIHNRCVTVFFPGTATTSPWSPYIGLMPVVVLDL